MKRQDDTDSLNSLQEQQAWHILSSVWYHFHSFFFTFLFKLLFLPHSVFTIHELMWEDGNNLSIYHFLFNKVSQS